MSIGFIQLNTSKILPAQHVINRKMTEVTVLDPCVCPRLHDPDCQRAEVRRSLPGSEHSELTLASPGPSHMVISSTESSRKQDLGAVAM